MDLSSSPTPWQRFCFRLLFSQSQTTELFTTKTYNLEHAPLKHNNHLNKQHEKNSFDLACCFSTACHSRCNMGFDEKSKLIPPYWQTLAWLALTPNEDCSHICLCVCVFPSPVVCVFIARKCNLIPIITVPPG